MSNARLKEQVFARPVRSKSKKLPKASVLATYAAVFALIVSFVAIGYRQPQESTLASTTASATAPTSTSSSVNLDKPSVDQLVATDIAANLAVSTDMPVAKNVTELSVSLAAKSDLAQTSDAAISKPQIIQLSSTGHSVTTYKSKAGDTVQSIATANNVTANTIKWANNLTSDAVEPGKDLVILPVDGVLYTTKAGDTAESIAAVYHADATRIVPFNDLEITGIVPGKQIVIPGGILPDNLQPGAAAAAAARAAAAGNSYGYGGNLYTINSGLGTSTTNGYAYGYCTWYAFERRMQLGRPVGGNWGNASSWAAYARAAGYRVDHIPEVGAVMQNGGGAGHVAIVEQVLPDGSVVLSEMNYAGNWNRVTKGRVVSAGQAASYNFIH